LFSDDESVLNVKATSFKSFDDRTEFIGNPAEIVKDDFSLVSDRFTVYLENGTEKTVEATQGVFINISTGSATSVELEYDLKEERGYMRKEVNAVFNSASSSETISINCDYLMIDNNSAVYEGKNLESEYKVKITKGNMNIECLSFKYDSKEEIINLIGDVFIDEPGEKTITGESVVLNLKTDEIDGNDVNVLQNSEDPDGDFKMNSSNIKMFDDRIEFYENSVIEKNDFSLSSDRFTVYKENGKEKHVEARDGVFVKFETGIATANNLNYDLEFEKGKLDQNVNAVIYGKNEDVSITCDSLAMDINNKIYNGLAKHTEKVIIRKDDLYAECSEFNYDSQLEMIALSSDIGGVYIEDPKNQRNLWGEYVILGMNDDSLEGTNVSMSINSDMENRINIKSDRLKIDDSKIDFLSSSEISKKDFKLVSDKFYVTRENGKEKEVIAENGVYAVFSTGKATGTTLDYFLDEEKGVMTGNVNAEIETKDSTQTIYLDCEKLDFDIKTETYKGNDNGTGKITSILKGNLNATCKDFIYDSEKNVMELTGDVFIDDPDNRRTVKASKIIYYLKDDTMEGENVNMRIITKK